jgi:hypothetical protein
MRKLYKVEVEDIVYVMAESEERAIDIALSEGTANDHDPALWKYKATEATTDNFDESTGWTLNYIPFGEDEKTIDEILRES